MSEKSLNSLEIFPAETILKKGDLNVRITNSVFLLPMTLFDYFCINMTKIKSVSDIINYLNNDAASFALEFKWRITEVKKARKKIIKQLKESGYNA